MAEHRRQSGLIPRICLILLFTLVAAHPADAEERANGSTEILLPTFAPLIKRISPSVVDVTATKRAGNDRAFIGPDGGFPDPPFPQDVNVAGSGVIVDADRGLIVTANHLVENVDTVTVAVVDGRQVSARMFVASVDDDLALLRIDAGGLAGIKMVDTDKPEIGDFVLAIGNPLGLGQSTTFGIISALHRSVPGLANVDLIQIDASIDRGSSGGALINIRGELIGVNVARFGRANLGGFGFAVPTDAIRRLLARGRLDR